FFSTKDHETYRPYCSDFGPVDLGSVVSFCRKLRSVADDPRLCGRKIVYYCTSDPQLASNAAWLLGAYLVLVEGVSPRDAAAPFERIQPSPFKPFRDASFLPSDFDLSLSDCLRGIQRAHDKGFFSLDSFDRHAFKAADKSGWSRMSPKFVACQGPVDVDCPAYAKHTDAWLDAFDAAGVKIAAVVRLNEADTYSPEVFAARGITHVDLEFEDCTCPSEEIVKEFFEVCSRENPGVIAVHCKAGLGRTGTLIALWLMAHSWTAREAIAWLRIARPGSVIGAQQQFL
ncbi:protein-tyrosine phosphatase-like protein, partial [Baffinella frigidus]